MFLSLYLSVPEPKPYAAKNTIRSFSRMPESRRPKKQPWPVVVGVRVVIWNGTEKKAIARSEPFPCIFMLSGRLVLVVVVMKHLLFSLLQLFMAAKNILLPASKRQLHEFL